MTLLEFILLLIIAGVCGTIAQVIVGRLRKGCIVSIIIGFIGALIGTWLARKFALPDYFVVNVGSRNFPVIWSIIGAVIFTAVLSLISSKKN